MSRDLHEQLTKYLTDAHSIEEQALAQLRSAPDHAGTPEIATAFREHLSETEGHERRIADLLEARDAAPSKLKDTVMKLGGKGFLLFAQLQPDTPGKLMAHSISYEALELASYELLSRVADRAGEADVSTVARSIADEERRMMQRLEGLVDESTEASLRDLSPDDLKEQLRKYLADAHAIEGQAIQLLERAPKIDSEDALSHVYEEHLDETREHQEMIAERLDALGGDSSSLKDAAMRLGALNWGAFFQAHPDSPGKLAAFAFAFEHLEIGGYEQLSRVADRAGDQETAALAARILDEERAAADKIESMFDRAAEASLSALDIETRTT